MLIIDVSEHKDVVKKLAEKVGKDNFQIEQIGTFDCEKELFPIKKDLCVTEDEFSVLVGSNIKYDRNLCKECSSRKYIRFADFTNDTHSFYYERKTVFDFISSRKRRLYSQLDRMDTFISGHKGLILEGMGEYTAMYDAYWKNINKTLLQKLSPIQQAIELGGKRKVEKIINGKKVVEIVDTREWVWSFVRELKMRGMEFVQTWSLNETIDFLIQCDEGYDHIPKLRLIPKRYPKFPIERNILALFDGIGIKRSEVIFKGNVKIKRDLERLIKDVEGLNYGKKET
jgi:hypothetical protein